MYANARTRLASRDRLRDIVRLGLDVPADRPELGDLARQAAQRLRMPIALVSVVLDTAQVNVASYGLSGWMLEVGGSPVEWSFCRYVVERRREFVVPDATRDERVSGMPTVRVDGVRSYAGAPLRSAAGFVLGSLCVIDVRPRAFSDAEVALLGTLAARAVDLIEAAAPPAPAVKGHAGEAGDDEAEDDARP